MFRHPSWRQPLLPYMVSFALPHFHSSACFRSDSLSSPADLSPDATILYSSDSIVDILGYHPNEVVNRSCWDFFHPDELPLAREKHGRGVQRDRAAVLSYCQMRDRNNQWVGCEAVFTVVYDVLVGCTTIYKAGSKSQSKNMSTRLFEPLSLLLMRHRSRP